MFDFYMGRKITFSRDFFLLLATPHERKNLSKVIKCLSLTLNHMSKNVPNFINDYFQNAFFSRLSEISKE